MKNIIRKWWPAVPDQSHWVPRMSRFYAESKAYHAMTSSKHAGHAQVALLSSLIRGGHTYAEVGCGGGIVSKIVAEKANLFGYDIAEIAVTGARRHCAGLPAELAVAPAENLPLADNSVDGVYSFEVLEHVWNPEAVLREMVRVLKPGGFLLVSTPNHLSLDLHLNKRAVVRLVERGCACLRFLQDKLSRRTYVNLVPDIEREDVYPDCDMISSLVPCNLPSLVRDMGCRLEFLDTFYMTNHMSHASPSLDFQRNSARPMIRYHGDHILFLATKL